MKKNLLKVTTFALLLCGTMISCQEDENMEFNKDPQLDMKVRLVEIGENNAILPVKETRSASLEQTLNYALQFDSEEAYREILTKMETMNHQQKIAFTDALGLVSMQKLLKIADEELETIGAEALNENDFRSKYKVYKEKYSKYFVFNSVDELDLSPYMPDGDEAVSYLVSIDHNMVIGDKVTEITFTQKMNENDSLLFASGVQVESFLRTRSSTDESEWPVNHFIEKPFSGKKTIFRFEPIGGREFGLHLGAQKKLWYGWKTDTARDFYFKLGASNFQYVISGIAGQPVWTNSPEYIYCYLNPGGKINITIGRGLGGDVKGKAYIWTDQTIEKDSKGNVVLEVVNGRNYPKGNTDKSLPCLLNWANGTY